MTNYSFYNDKYLSGKEAVIDAASFPYWERKASNIVRNMTFGNIDEAGAVPEVVQMCVCEVAELLAKQEKSAARGVTSEKVGDYSVSYAMQTKAEQVQEVVSVVRNWLLDTGLMYCGVM